MSDLAQRSDRAVRALVASWGETSPSDARWYEESVAAWLSSVAESPHTVRSYTATVAGFFAWAEASGAARVPHRVKTTDVEAWVRFLESGGRTVPPTLDKEERAALDAVSNGQGDRESVAKAIDKTRFLNGLLASASIRETTLVLGRLATKRLVVKEPGSTVLGTEPRWRLPPPKKDGLAPSTLAQRLSALESFFHAIIGQGGQKAGLDQRGPMTVSPVPPVLERYTKRALGVRRARSDARKTRPADWEALRSACWERARPEGWKQRDWTIIVCLATTGLRVAELCPLRLRDIENVADAAGGRTSRVTVRRKGGRVAEIVIPEVAMAEVVRLRTALRPEEQGSDRPMAAMAVRRWGRQAHLPQMDPLSTRQVQTIFRSIAKQMAADSGEDPKKVEQRIHPHGLRHLYAETLAASGVPIHEIRTLLGHQSLATTDGYLSREAGTGVDHTDHLGPMAWPADDADFAMNGKRGRKSPRR